MKYEWREYEVANQPGQGIAFHRACVVVSPNKTKVNLFKLVENRSDKGLNKIQEEGIYFFGGKNQDDDLLNTLRILKIGKELFILLFSSY